MRVLYTLLLAYPRHSFAMVFLLLLASFAEGISATAVLPLLHSIVEQDAQTNSVTEGFAEQIIAYMKSIGIKPTVGTLLIIMVLGVFLRGLLQLISNRYLGYIAARLQTDLRLNLLSTIMRSRWTFFVHQSIGKLVNTMSIEIPRTADSYVNGILVISLIMTVTIYTSIAVIVSWQATVFALSAVASIWFIFSKLIKMARKAGRRQTAIYQSLSARLADTLQSVKLYKAMAKEHLANVLLVIETEQLNRELKRGVLSGAVLNAIRPPLFTAIMAIGIFIALTYLNMVFTTVLTLTVLLLRVLICIGKIQQHYHTMTLSESAYWAVLDIIQKAENASERQLGTQLPHLKHEIKLDNVSFAYDERNVIKNLSLTIPAGEMTVLLGASGAGKTTIIDLILGLQNPGSGQVIIDGVDLNAINLKTWRQRIGYVPQENILLHDTVLNNLTLGDKLYTEADAWRALEATQAAKFVERLPNGLYSTLGERGIMLSGGQRQRIMIARALMQKPWLLVLDEATSALDPENEQRIFETLLDLKGTLTMLVVSHRQSLTAFADHFYRILDESECHKEHEEQGQSPDAVTRAGS